MPPGPALADALRSSPVIQGEDGYTPAASFGAGFDDIDPNLDPELALVSYCSYHLVFYQRFEIKNCFSWYLYSQSPLNTKSDKILLFVLSFDGIASILLKMHDFFTVIFASFFC